MTGSAGNAEALIVSPGYYWNTTAPTPIPEFYNASKCQWKINVDKGYTLAVVTAGATVSSYNKPEPKPEPEPKPKPKLKPKSKLF